jgi:hypothetical protein
MSSLQKIATFLSVNAEEVGIPSREKFVKGVQMLFARCTRVMPPLRRSRARLGVRRQSYWDRERLNGCRWKRYQPAFRRQAITPGLLSIRLSRARRNGP